MVHSEYQKPGLYLNCVALSLSSTDPGSHSGVLSASDRPGFFRAGGPGAEIHWPTGYRSHHQPHRPVTVYRSWEEVWRSLGNICSVSVSVLHLCIAQRIQSYNEGHTVCT